MWVDVYEVTLRKKQVNVPDTCQNCGNAFNEPGESSLLSSRLEGASYWAHVDGSGRRPRLDEGESHHTQVDRQIRVALACGECGHDIAAPVIDEAPQ